MTVELLPELEREIEAAARRALDPDAALDALLDSLLDNRTAKRLPPLSDEQLSRAAFYDEKETPKP